MEDYITEYLTHLETLNRRSGTIARYGQILRRLMRFLSEKGIERWAEVEVGHLEEYLSRVMRGEDGLLLSLSNLRSITSRMRTFFAFLVDRGLVLTSPASLLSSGPPVMEERVPRIPTEPEIEELLEVAAELGKYGERNRAIVELFYGTGLRRGELVNLDLENVDLSEGIVVVREGKCGKDRAIPMSHGARERLARYLGGTRGNHDKGLTSAVFLGEHGNRLGESGIEHIFRKMRRLVTAEDLHAHLLRHACARDLLRGGMDFRLLQDLLGHEQLKTTTRYAQVVDEDLARDLRARHPRGGMNGGSGRMRR